MQLQKKRRDVTWKQVLFLLVYGAVLGRLSFANVDMWGSGHDTRHQGLYGAGFLVGVVSFLAGILGFLVILAQGVFTSPPSPVAVARGVSTKEPPVKRGAVVNRGGAALVTLRVSLFVAIGVACLGVQQQVESKSLWGGSYYESYRLGAVLVLIMSQLPYAFALYRTWTGPDRFGLAIAISTGIVEANLHLPFFNNSAVRPDVWSLIASLLGVAVAILAYSAWRSAGPREGDLHYAGSVFGGFLAYTLLWRVAEASLLLPY